ncbi:hypothetical protein DEO72_LG9g2115 [Vigna unguiculata]|uniref:Uncharacterized protein n=1 Tax=Vigna unguiculata TaxID=3917 RepID=A0A4D6N3N4_VIGUN|nr:hypothetical protein DEO72_LG9g2115 [Vigna unguiculata]
MQLQVLLTVCDAVVRCNCSSDKVNGGGCFSHKHGASVPFAAVVQWWLLDRALVAQMWSAVGTVSVEAVFTAALCFSAMLLASMAGVTRAGGGCSQVQAVLRGGGAMQEWRGGGAMQEWCGGALQLWFLQGAWLV